MGRRPAPSSSRAARRHLVRGLELDDAAGELGFERAQLGARAGRDPPRRVARCARPLGSASIVHAARHAAARAQQPVDRHAAHACGHLGRVARQRSRAITSSAPSGAGERTPSGVDARRAPDASRLASDAALVATHARVPSRGQRPPCACPVGVVDDEQRRARRRAARVSGVEAPAGGTRGRPRRARSRRRAWRLAGQLGREARSCPCPSRARDRDEPPTGAARAPPSARAATRAPRRARERRRRCAHRARAGARPHGVGARSERVLARGPPRAGAAARARARRPISSEQPRRDRAVQASSASGLRGRSGRARASGARRAARARDARRRERWSSPISWACSPARGSASTRSLEHGQALLLPR